VKSFSLFTLAFVLLLAPSTALSQTERSQTLSDVKKKYLNQPVVICGNVGTNYRDLRVLEDWHPASEAGGHYKTEIMRDLPPSYKGLRGIVIAIQFRDRFLDDNGSQQKANALGDVVSFDQIANPYFDFVIKLENSQIITTTGYPGTIGKEVELAREHDALAQEIKTQLPKVVGKNLYAVGYARLYPLEAALEEIQDPSARSKQLAITDMPLLEPLQITAVKYNEAADAIILKLRLPKGGEVLSVANTQGLDTKQNVPFLEKISDPLLVTVPGFLTAREVTAIKRHSIFRGMRETALDYVMGFPDKENDWGSGGKQYVYSDTLFVYIGVNGKVENWQSLGD
jgi:hypothetical protein